MKDYLSYPTLCPIGDQEEEYLKEKFLSAESSLEKGRECQSEEHWEDAVHFFELAAKKGSAEAMKCLGYCLWKGMGTETNLYRALECYGKAMDEGEEDTFEFMDEIYDEIKNERKRKKNNKLETPSEYIF